MYRVEVSQAARTDLTEIDDYGLDRFGREAADRMSAGIYATFSMLAEYPESAPERPEYGKGLRCKMCGVYRILYSFDGQQVLILRVMHHSRDVDQTADR